MKSLANDKKFKTQVDLAIFEDIVKKYFVNKLQEREIVGAFNQINSEK